MATIAEKAVRNALTVLLDIHGETVTFRNKLITVQCDRRDGSVPMPTMDGMSIQTNIVSSILVEKSLIKTAPLIGEVFVDSAGNFHVISRVLHYTTHYRCYCEYTIKDASATV